MKLKLGDKSYQLRYGIRALILFEKMADKPFSLHGTTDWTIFVYAMLAGSPDCGVELDEFVDGVAIPDLDAAIRWATKQLDVENQLAEAAGDDVKKKR
jgi:hypothetical protein